MFVVYGIKLYGKADEVPQQFHVGTEFFHIYFVPLVPLKSVICVGRGSDSRYGGKVAMSVKSVVLAWLRFALLLGAIVMVIRGVADLLAGGTSMAWLAAEQFAIAAAMVIVATFTWRVRGLGRATYLRAQEIAAKIGLREESLVMIELAFGRVSRSEAEGTLAQLRDDARAMERLAKGEMVGDVPAVPPMVPGAVRRG